MKDATITIRLTSEHKHRLIEAAHGADISLSEAILFSVDNYFVEHYLQLAKRFSALKEAMKPGEQRDKISAILEDFITTGEWFQREAETVKDLSDSYKEIESIESYRDFLREAVATE